MDCAWRMVETGSQRILKTDETDYDAWAKEVSHGLYQAGGGNSQVLLVGRLSKMKFPRK